MHVTSLNWDPFISASNCKSRMYIKDLMDSMVDEFSVKPDHRIHIFCSQHPSSLQGIRHPCHGNIANSSSFRCFITCYISHHSCLWYFCSRACCFWFSCFSITSFFFSWKRRGFLLGKPSACSWVKCCY